MAAPTVGLTIIKAMPYRNIAAEEWSNHYWLTGTTPADSAAWRALFDALVLEEKKLYSFRVNVVGGYGYNSVSPTATAVWSVDLTVPPNTVVPGTYTASGTAASGDSAGWIRWGLDRMNSKGKRVYLRKYFHDVYPKSGTPDELAAAQLTAYNAFGAKLRDGSFTGARVTTDRLGTALVGTASSAYLTTRTLKRRGKRPPT